jgi:hypothetical protein
MIVKIIKHIGIIFVIARKQAEKFAFKGYLKAFKRAFMGL